MMLLAPIAVPQTLCIAFGGFGGAAWVMWTATWGLLWEAVTSTCSASLNGLVDVTHSSLLSQDCVSCVSPSPLLLS